MRKKYQPPEKTKLEKLYEKRSLLEDRIFQATAANMGDHIRAQLQKAIQEVELDIHIEIEYEDWKEREKDPKHRQNWVV